MARKHTQRIAVIGGVAAGPAAAAEAKRVDPNAHVALFERGPRISYGACEIPYFVGGTIADIENLVAFDPAEFERKKGVSVHVHTDVRALNPRAGELSAVDLRTGEERTERFDKFILATGARAHVPGFGGTGAPNLHVVRDLADAARLRHEILRLEQGRVPAYFGRRIVIVGGGYIGTELADVLRLRGHSVTLLQPGGRLLPGALDDELSTVVSDVARSSIQLRDDRVSRVVLDPANRIQTVETESGERIACVLLIAATGIVPETRLAVEAGIRVGDTGAIRVSDRMKTNVANVWACGDCIEVKRIPDGANVHLPLATTAYRTARVAARNAANRGGSSADGFSGVTPAFAVVAFGLEIASVGLTLSQAREAGLRAESATIKQHAHVSLLPNANPVHVTLVYEGPTGRLLGGQLVGRSGAALRANALVPLIRSRATLATLEDVDFLYTPPIAPPLDPLYVAARAAQRNRSAKGFRN